MKQSTVRGREVFISREKLEVYIGSVYPVIMSCRKQREQMEGVGGSGAKVEQTAIEEDEDDDVDDEEKEEEWSEEE